MVQTRTLKDFKSLKNHEHKITKTIFVKDLVVGDHPISYKLLKHLHEKNGNQEEVKWIHQFDFMAPFAAFSLEGIRGQEAGEILKEFYPTLELQEFAGAAKFYKDGEFKEFGGRVKPHEIPLHERYFMQKIWKFDALNFWGRKEDYEALSANHVKGLVTKFSKLSNDTLASKENWQVELSDGTAYQCENLWVTYTPGNFLSLFDKTQSDVFSSGFHQFCKTSDGLHPLAIKFKLKSEVTKELGTLFIPQSQTHEWGSFIIEMDKELNLTALMFMSEAESDHEEVGKKIKLLKRVLDRVFDNFEKKIINESISFAQNPINYNLSDEVHGQTDFIPHLNFISELGFIPFKNSPVNSLQGLSRLIYLYKQATI